MKKDITNIVVDLKDGQRISIIVDNETLELSALFDSIESLCERFSGCTEMQVAVSGLIQAARFIDEYGKLDARMMPTFSVCIEQMHEILGDLYGDTYSGGIYIKEDDDGTNYHDEFYFVALNGLLEERELTEFTITDCFREHWGDE